MKKFIIIPLTVLALVACNNSSKTDAKAASKSISTELNKPSAKQLYICPMDSDITSDKPDTCSKCGMDLIKKEN